MSIFLVSATSICFKYFTIFLYITFAFRSFGYIGKQIVSENHRNQFFENDPNHYQPKEVTEQCSLNRYSSALLLQFALILN